MKNFLNKIKTYIVANKVKSVIALIILLALGYWGYGKITSTAGDIRYVLSTVTKGTIISSISGTGQVSVSNQVDLKPNVSGTITYIGVKPGDKVVKGETLFSIDNKDAQKAVRDAEISLESAQLSLNKLEIQNSDENMNADLVKVYDDGFNDVSNTFLDLVPTVDGINNILGQTNLSDSSARNNGNTAVDYRNQTETLYYQVKDALNKNETDFRTLNRNSSKSDIENIINETYTTTKLLSDTIKSTKNFVDYLAQDTGKLNDFISSQNTLSTYTNTINTDLSSLLSSQTSIKSSKDALPNANLDMQSSLLSVKQKENALQDAKDKLSDYYITAPFNGTIASVPVNVGDDASSGTVLGTIITSQKLATIPLNEVDVAKIKLGQKATLTFDAVPDLTISGEVAQIDSIGTVSQGVVNYNVKISFDTQDVRIKAGMSVSASIITEVKQDILVVPNSAVKSQNSGNYVEMFDTPLPVATDGLAGSISKIAPNKISVEVGISDDSQTEIISGIKEGDKIVTRTILSTSTTTKTTTTSSLFGSAGARGGAIGR